jgi:hypothetical protein
VKSIDVNNFSITPSMTMMALVQSGLEWAVPPAQQLALENLALNSPVEVHTVIQEDNEVLRVFPVMRTLCGIPSTMDRLLPSNCIELRLAGTPLIRIESLALPAGME